MRRTLRRLFGPVVAVALLVVAAGCDYPLVSPQGAAPLRYRDKVFPGVSRTADIVYGSAVDLSGRTVTLRLDLYQPTGDKLRARAAIVWVHGGSFRTGSRRSPEIVDQASELGRLGYVSVSIGYRLEPDGCSAAGPTPTCLKAIRQARVDAQAAVRFLRSKATAYRIDPTRIAIAGTSAGAITALGVGFASAESPRAAVRAAVSLSGANILVPIGVGDAPALLFHGTADTAVPYRWATDTVTAARAAGIRALLTTFVGEGHVPYNHRDEIIRQTRDFLYGALRLSTALR